MTVRGLITIVLTMSACASGLPQPVAIDLGRDVCAHCRMVISSRATAAQIVSPGEEPRLFDDIGCLRSDIAGTPPPAGSLIVVADHVTGDWLVLEDAVLTEVPQLQTPMGSGLIAHRSTLDRDGDPAARGGRPVAASALLGGGRR